jgi:hypothetical protein
MKTGLHSSLLKTVLLLVSLASSIGSLATSQAGTSDAFFVGAAHIGAPHHRQGSAQGYLLVYSATDPFDDGGLVFLMPTAPTRYTHLTGSYSRTWKIISRGAMKFPSS